MAWSPSDLSLIENYLRANHIEEYTIQMIIMQLGSGLGDPQFFISNMYEVRTGLHLAADRRSVQSRSTQRGASYRITSKEAESLRDSTIRIRDVIRRLMLNPRRGDEEFFEYIMFILRQLLGNLITLLTQSV
jgi:hypothetical protein